MKKYYYSLVLLFVTGVVSGQAFENPVNWFTSNSFSIYCSAGVSVTKATDAKEGLFAVRLEGKNGALIGKTIPGVITTGILTGGINVSGGQSHTTKSERLTGYYKYSPQGSDMAGIEVSLTKWNSTTHQRDIIAYGNVSKEAAADYTAFEVLLSYNSTIVTPDSQLVVISSSANRSNAIAGSVLYIDNLSFSGEVSSTSNSNYNVDPPKINVYPNPVKDFLWIKIYDFEEGEYSWILYNQSGQLKLQGKIFEHESKISFKSFSSGSYILKVNRENRLVKTFNVIKFN